MESTNRWLIICLLLVSVTIGEARANEQNASLVGGKLERELTQANLPASVNKRNILEQMNEIASNIRQSWERALAQLDPRLSQEDNFLAVALKELTKFKANLMINRTGESKQPPSKASNGQTDAVATTDDDETWDSEPLVGGGKLETPLDVDEAIARLVTRERSLKSIKNRTTSLLKGLMGKELRDLAMLLGGIHPLANSVPRETLMGDINRGLAIKVIEFLIGVFIDIMSAIFGRNLEIEPMVASVNYRTRLTTENPMEWMQYQWSD